MDSVGHETTQLGTEQALKDHAVRGVKLYL
jgi:hypothetical protein